MADDVFVIGTRGGYEGEVGVMASMLQNARQYLLSAVRGLDTASLDARPAPAVNTIGSILAHLAAAEVMIGLRAFENRRPTEEEKRVHGPAFQFEDSSRPAGRPLDSYLDVLRTTRETTLQRMRGRPDSWLQESRVFAGRPANVHYFLLHYLQANKCKSTNLKVKFHFDSFTFGLLGNRCNILLGFSLVLFQHF